MIFNKITHYDRGIGKLCRVCFAVFDVFLFSCSADTEHITCRQSPYLFLKRVFRYYGHRINEFHDIGLFDESSIKEKEANLFAAEFLLDDDEVLDVLNGDSTFFSAASQLYVPAELLDFKFRVMKWKGYKLIEPPVDVHNNFLKDIPMPAIMKYSVLAAKRSPLISLFASLTSVSFATTGIRVSFSVLSS